MFHNSHIYDIQHTKGRNNIVADLLSRYFYHTLNFIQSEHKLLYVEYLAFYQISDPELYKSS